MKYLILISLIFCSGCVFNHDSDYTLTGTNIKTVYGTGNVNVHIVGHTAWGKNADK